MAIADDPPALLSKGDVIRGGFNEELDDLRHTIRNSKELLVEIQQHEAKRTGIQNLKIGFNNVFGYYLEVTNRYKDQGLIPPDWVRKQTLTNAERYVTEELKKLEQKILGAEEQITIIEEQLYLALINTAQEYIAPIQHDGYLVAQLDCLIAFAQNALKNQYCRPEVNDSYHIDIKAGRHPVIERQLPLGESYVPNDVFLDCDTQQLLMITGPNMSGKSALLRQTALICIMAQMGSYVPATSASLGFLDKLFTRVGASDNISSGESTFMVEMNETASIMNNVSQRSLILLDEIGRGTSTYDGISIAWSVAEYLHDNPYGRPKTLFATHYHELNALTSTHERIKNFHVATQETDNKVLFLRTLVEGGTEHSFGIHVAKMAGMPKSILFRAQRILVELEKKETEIGGQRPKVPAQNPMQLSIFEHVDPLAAKLKEMIADLNINQLTPVECMLKLIEMKKFMDEEG
jgi:DNA mismatch repair protein MutS